MDALQGRTIEGKVTRISPMLDPATRSGSVQVEIPNPDGQLKAEMSARIQMETGTQREALLVPREAIIMRGDQSGVNVLDGDRARFQAVETGISSGGGVEILSGLKTGMKVITRGTQSLQDGSSVTVLQGDSQDAKPNWKNAPASPTSNDGTGAEPAQGGRGNRRGARS
jgi:membrane fusion protein (multidrug efflux system)